MTLASVELTPAEIRTLLALVQARHADLGRMVQGLEEGEGMDLQRHNALKTLRPQVEALEDLVLKLEGAAQDAMRAPR